MHFKTSHVWEVFPCIGCLRVYGKASSIREVFPSMGRLPIHGKFSHGWEVVPSKLCIRVAPHAFDGPSTCHEIVLWQVETCT